MAHYFPHSATQTDYVYQSGWLTLLYGWIANDNHRMDIGRAIYALRKEKGLKLEAVALDAGTDSGHLSRIETGSRKPSLAMLERIAAAMDVRVSMIVTLAEGEVAPSATGQIHNADETDLSEESIQVRRRFRTLTPDNQRALLEIAIVLNRLQRGE